MGIILYRDLHGARSLVKGLIMFRGSTLGEVMNVQSNLCSAPKGTQTDRSQLRYKALVEALREAGSRRSGTGVFERGARAAQEGFGQLAEGKLNVFNPESQIRKTLPTRCSSTLSNRQEESAQEGRCPKGLKWFQKIRPGANAVWDTIAHGGMGKALLLLPELLLLEPPDLHWVVRYR